MQLHINTHYCQNKITIVDIFIMRPNINTLLLEYHIVIWWLEFSFTLNIRLLNNINEFIKFSVSVSVKDATKKPNIYILLITINQQMDCIILYISLVGC